MGGGMFTLPSLMGLALGAGGGALLARRRNGSGADIAHYAGVFAIIGFFLGLMISLVVGPPG